MSFDRFPTNLLKGNQTFIHVFTLLQPPGLFRRSIQAIVRQFGVGPNNLGRPDLQTLRRDRGYGLWACPRKEVEGRRRGRLSGGGTLRPASVLPQPPLTCRYVVLPSAAPSHPWRVSAAVLSPSRPSTGTERSRIQLVVSTSFLISLISCEIRSKCLPSRIYETTLLTVVAVIFCVNCVMFSF